MWVKGVDAHAIGRLVKLDADNELTAHITDNHVSSSCGDHELNFVFGPAVGRILLRDHLAATRTQL